MSNQRKVVVTQPEHDAEVRDLALEDNIIVEDFLTLEITEDEDAVDVRAEDPIQFDQIVEEEEDFRPIEDLDDNEPIWEDGPVAGQIKEWKKQFGDVYVTSISFDKHVVWRVLNRNEYKQIVKKMEQLVQAGSLTSAEANMWNEETIAELCILFPKFDKKTLSGAMAGMPSLIAQEVLEASGFVALEVRQL